MLDDCQHLGGGRPVRQPPPHGVLASPRLLQQRGKRIVPIHPDAHPSSSASRATPPWPTCRSRSTWSTCSGAPRSAGEFADQAVAVGARGVWFQLGVIDEDAVRAHPRRRCPHGHGHLPGHRVAPPVRRLAVGGAGRWWSWWRAWSPARRSRGAGTTGTAPSRPTTPLAEQCDEVPAARRRMTLDGQPTVQCWAAHWSARRTPPSGVVLRQGASQTICEWLPWAGERRRGDRGQGAALRPAWSRVVPRRTATSSAEPGDTVVAVDRLRDRRRATGSPWWRRRWATRSCSAPCRGAVAGAVRRGLDLTGPDLLRRPRGRRRHPARAAPRQRLGHLGGAELRDRRTTPS